MAPKPKAAAKPKASPKAKAPPKAKAAPAPKAAPKAKSPPKKKAARRELTRAGTFAKRFAAKEACAKALGTGFRQGVFFRDLGVVNLPSGAPTMNLTGGAAARLEKLTPPGHRAHVHLTMTDDHPWAQAFVIIEALPA